MARSPETRTDIDASQQQRQGRKGRTEGDAVPLDLGPLIPDVGGAVASAEEQNDATMMALAQIGSLVPTTTDEYLVITQRLSAILESSSFRYIQDLVHQTLREFAKEYPELSAQALAAQQAKTREQTMVAGLGSSATQPIN